MADQASSLAAVFSRAGHIDMQRLPVPTPVDDELLVRILGCTLCASDLHSYEGRRSVPCPSILGHEIVGEIAAFGPEASQCDSGGEALSIGSRVSWAVVAACGHCVFCQSDLPQKCLGSTKYGHEAFSSGRELLGGLAEHCLLVSGTQTVRWPDEVPLAVACPASCATATAMAAIDCLPELKQRTVMVIGAGMLGLTSCAIAKWLDAAQIICVDPVMGRLERAQQFGATVTLQPGELADWFSNNLPLGVDAVIEMSGSNAGFESAWQHVRLGGAMALVGAVFPSGPMPIVLEQIVRRCLHIHGIHNYAPQHLRQAVRFLTETYSMFPFASLVDQWYPLRETQAALAAAAVPGAVRIGVRMT